MARQCIFCSSVDKITAEHVFPNWLNGVFPSANVGQTKVEQSLVHSERSGWKRSYSKAEVASATTQSVCRTCNNGWMGKLEQEAKQILLPMAKGEKRPLSLKDQLVLATWATKTMFVVATTWDEPLGASDDDYRVLMSESRPPARIRVWALAYEGSIGPLRATSCVARVDQTGGAHIGVAFLGTLQVGTLVLQVGGGAEGVPTGPGLEAEGSITPTRLQLYPPTPSKLCWPPNRVLDEQGLRAASTDLSVLDPRINSVRVPGINQS